MLPKSILFNISHIARQWDRFTPCVPMVPKLPFDDSFRLTKQWDLALRWFRGPVPWQPTCYSESFRDAAPFYIRQDSLIAVRRMLRPLWPAAPALAEDDLHAALLVDVCLTMRGLPSCGRLVRDDGVLFYELGDREHSVLS